MSLWLDSIRGFVGDETRGIECNSSKNWPDSGFEPVKMSDHWQGRSNSSTLEKSYP